MGPMSIQVCRGTPGSYQKTPFEKFAINGFLVNREHMTCLSWAATHLV